MPIGSLYWNCLAFLPQINRCCWRISLKHSILFITLLGFLFYGYSLYGISSKLYHTRYFPSDSHPIMTKILNGLDILFVGAGASACIYTWIEVFHDAEKLAWLLWFCLGSILHKFLWMMCMLMATWAENETKDLNPWLSRFEHFFSSDPVFDFIGHLVTLGGSIFFVILVKSYVYQYLMKKQFAIRYTVCPDQVELVHFSSNDDV